MKFKKSLTSTIRIKSCKTQRYNMNSKLQLINISKSISQLTLINFLLKIIQKSKCRQICKNPLNNCSNLPQFSLRMFKMKSLRVIRSNLWRILLPPINMKNLIRMNKVKDSLKNLPSKARRMLFNNSHNYKGKIPNKQSRQVSVNSLSRIWISKKVSKRLPQIILNQFSTQLVVLTKPQTALTKACRYHPITHLSS